MDTTDQSAGQLEVVDLVELTGMEQRVMVMIQHPKMPAPFESCYGVRFEVQAGDSVLCPPAPLWPEPFVGIVTGFGDGGYKGPVKYLIRKVTKEE